MRMVRRRALVVIALGVALLYYLSYTSKEKQASNSELRRARIREWKQKHDKRSLVEYLNKRAELLQRMSLRKSTPRYRGRHNSDPEVHPGVFERKSEREHVVYKEKPSETEIRQYEKATKEDPKEEKVEDEPVKPEIADDDGTSAERRKEEKKLAKKILENQSEKVATFYDPDEIAEIMKKKEVSKVIMNDWTKFNWQKFNKGCPGNKYRRRLKELMRAWIKITKKHFIRYCLTYGSLVGAMRNGEIIPHDKDIDVYINEADYKDLLKAAEERNFDANDGRIHLVVQEDYFKKPMDDRIRKSCQGEVVDHPVDHCAFQEPLARLIRKDRHIDIYPLQLESDLVTDPVRYVEFFRKDLLPFQTCHLMGLRTSCPNNGKAILSAYYYDTDPLRPLYQCVDGKWVSIDD